MLFTGCKGRMGDVTGHLFHTITSAAKLIAWACLWGQCIGGPFDTALFLDSRGLCSTMVREVHLLIEKEGLQGGKGDNKWVGRHRPIHDPGIQQEP